MNLNRILTIIVLSFFIMTPIVLSVETEESPYTDNYETDIVGQSNFAKITSNEQVYTKNVDEPLYQGVALPVTAAATTGAVAAGAVATGLCSTHPGLCIVAVGAAIVVGVTATISVGAAITDAVGGWGGTADATIHFEVDVPEAAMNEEKFNVTLDVECDGDDCDWDNDEFCVPVKFGIKTDENMEIGLHGGEMHHRSSFYTTKEYCGQFDQTTIVFDVIPHMDPSIISKEVGFFVKVSAMDYTSHEAAFTLPIVSNEPDVNGVLCETLGGAWDSTQKCCGDDPEDCGRVSSDKSMICVGDTDSTNWGWYYTGDNYEVILENGCGKYPVFSNGAEWIACTAGDYLGDRCLLSLSGVTNAHAAECGRYEHNIVCTPPDGYDLSCHIQSGACNEGEGYVKVIGMSNLTNAHVGFGPEETYSVCCKATDESRENILSTGGSEQTLALWTKQHNNSHAAFGVQHEGYTRQITLNSDDPKIKEFECAIESIPIGRVDPNIRTFTTSPITNPFGGTAGTIQHDYVCHLSGNTLTITECAGDENRINDQYSIGSPNPVELHDRTVYCSIEELFVTDLDVDQGACESSDNQWIGEEAGDGACCGDDYREFFNLDSTGMDLELGTNLGDACWNSTPIDDGGYASLYEGESEVEDISVVNMNGTFYGCELPDEPYSNLIDSSATGSTPLFSEDQKKGYCDVVSNNDLTMYCNYILQEDDTYAGGWSDAALKLEDEGSGWSDFIGVIPSEGDPLEGATEIESSDGIPSELPYPSSACCPTGYCWDQVNTECVSGRIEDIETKGIVIKSDYACLDGEWKGEGEYNLKEDWDGDLGFCLEPTDCAVINITEHKVSLCVQDGTYIEDHICEEGIWYTRTSKVANELLGYVNAGDDYVLFCDDYRKVFPYFPKEGDSEAGDSLISLFEGQGKCVSDDLYLFADEWADYPGIWNNEDGYRGLVLQAGENVDCINNVCVLRKNSGGATEKVYFGFSHNNYDPAVLPNYNIKDYLSPLQTNYESDEDLGIIIYDLGDSQVGSAPRFALIGSLVNWLYDVFTALTSQKPWITISKDTQRVYYAETSGGRKIFGVIDVRDFKEENKQMFLRYKGFDNLRNIIPMAMTYDDSAPDVQFVHSINPSDIEDYWLNLTVKLRPNDNAPVSPPTPTSSTTSTTLSGTTTTTIPSGNGCISVTFDNTNNWLNCYNSGDIQQCQGATPTDYNQFSCSNQDYVRMCFSGQSDDQSTWVFCEGGCSSYTCVAK